MANKNSAAARSADTALDRIAVEDKRVEIRMTEQITGNDGPDEIAAKRARLIEAMQRHGVPVDEINITEEFLDRHGRSLIATGMGKPIEMTEEMANRRKDELAAKGHEALVAIAASVDAKTGASSAAATLAEAERLNAETRALADQIAADLAKLNAAKVAKDPETDPNAGGGAGKDNKSS